jgi:hypothetical protein
MAKKSYRKKYSTKKRGGLVGSSAEAPRVNGVGADGLNHTVPVNGLGADGLNHTVPVNGLGAAQPPADGANGAEMERQESIRAAAAVNQSVTSSATELATPPPSISTSSASILTPTPSISSSSATSSPTSVLKGGYKSRRKSKRNKKCKSKRNKKCKSSRK